MLPYNFSVLLFHIGKFNVFVDFSIQLKHNIFIEEENTMNTTARTIDYKGETCIELISGDYRALIAPLTEATL